MGGRGGRRVRGQDLDHLESIAKRKLSEADKGARRNVFISFATEDMDEVNLLRGQAKDKSTELNFSDRSIRVPFDSDDAEYIRRGIREKMKQVSVTVVYLSEDTEDSRWVDWEIRESHRLGKGVVGLHKGQSPPARMPPAIEELGVQVISWTHENLMQAIEDAAEQR